MATVGNLMRDLLEWSRKRHSIDRSPPSTNLRNGRPGKTSYLGSAMNDTEMMKLAIAMAGLYEPPDPSRVPRVGAVIADAKGNVLAFGNRGADTHAEKCAIDKITDRHALKNATVYTTLEPCTGAVRSRPQEACTNLLTEALVQRVVIGILDPNQGVCGKGVLELQKHGIEVSLFDHELAIQIRDMNAQFIRAQQSLGVDIIAPAPHEVLNTYLNSGWHKFRCTCVNEPTQETLIIVRKGSLWWPQSGKLRRIEDTNEYEFDVNFGDGGEHEVVVVKANELGMVLEAYYRYVSNRNQIRREKLRASPIYNNDLDIEMNRIGDYPGIPMTNLPRGLDRQASIVVKVQGSPPSNNKLPN